MRLNRQRLTEDTGSAMIIAITVIAIASMLSLAVVSRTSNGLTSARQNQDYAGALAFADAGVSDALFRVDQAGTAGLTSFCVGSGCPVTQVPGAPGVQYRVDVNNPNTVTVRSKGIDNGVPHAVKAQFVRELEFPFAIFAKSAASFKGNVDGASCATVPCEGVYYVDGSEPPVVLTAETATVGTTGTVTCTGTGSPADAHATYPGATNNGCPNHVDMTGVYDPKDPITGPCPAPASTPPTPCRGATGYTTLTAAQCANQSGAIAPGRYFCATDLKFTGTTTIAAGTDNGGAVEYFVIPTAPATADVVIEGVSVNLSGSTAGYIGDPTKFRINLAGAGDLDGGNGAHAGKITGIVYAPSATSTNNGCKLDIRGSLVINDYTCNGAPHLQVQYDSRITSLRQSNWTLRNFEEIPAGDVTIP